MNDDTNLWDATDALFGQLPLQADLEIVTVGMGFPVDIETKHVWISGTADGEQTSDLSGETGPDSETFRFSVFVYCQAADDYVTVRDELRTLIGAVKDALRTPEFSAVVPAWRLSRWAMDEGTDGTNRQLCKELVIECRCW